MQCKINYTLIRLINIFSEIYDKERVLQYCNESKTWQGKKIRIGQNEVNIIYNRDYAVMISVINDFQRMLQAFNIQPGNFNMKTTTQKTKSASIAKEP